MSLKSLICAFSVSFLMLFFSGKANGIILHPGKEPPVNWTGRPDNDIIGRWNSNASCVVIGPNYIVTTRHQGGGVESSSIEVGGITYSVDKIINHPVADLRLVKLKHANFTKYASINFGTDEVTQPENTLIGGFGRGRSTTAPPLNGKNTNYGYYWDSTSNTNQRWGTNNIVATSTHTLNGLTSNLLVCQFEIPSNTPYECTIAMFDSGGGWFLPSGDANGWKVIGLSRVIPFNGESWFLYYNGRSKPYTISQYTDQMSFEPGIKANHLDAVRISSYANWIESNMDPVCDLYIDTDFDGNCFVGAGDLAHFASMWLSLACDETNNFCEHSDLFRDGKVNLEDFVIFATDWMLISN